MLGSKRGVQGPGRIRAIGKSCRIRGPQNRELNSGEMSPAALGSPPWKMAAQRPPLWGINRAAWGFIWKPLTVDKNFLLKPLASH